MSARWLLLALVMACGGGTGAAPSVDAPTAQSAANAPSEAGKRADVGAEDFVALQAQGVRLVDVRTPGEYAAGHIPGATSVPLDTLQAGDAKLGDKGEPLYLVCESGRRSGIAADKLAAAGYHAVNVLGGTAAWRNAGRPLE